MAQRASSLDQGARGLSGRYRQTIGRLMKIILILVALAAGLFNAVEAGTNGALQKGLNAPMLAVAFISIVTLVCATIGAGLLGEHIPSLAAARELPWWAWLGGLLGFGFVSAIVFTAEPLGAATFIGLTVTASTIGSVLLDHYGLIGFERHPAGWARILGALLMVVGVTLVTVS